jgi:hypothetical protein
LLRRSILENGSHQKCHAKGNETSKMKITNGDDHCFLKFYYFKKILLSSIFK